MSMQHLTLYEKLAKLKARYFGYAATAVFFLATIGLRDYGILYNFEHGYTDATALNDLYLPIYTVEASIMEAWIELAAIAGLLGFAGLILVARSKTGEDVLP